jgi:hypothetical protein
MFERMREMRTGPPRAMEILENLQQEHLESFHRAYPMGGPPNIKDIEPRLHRPSPGVPSTQPYTVGGVTYTPTHIEYHYDGDPDAPSTQPFNVGGLKHTPTHISFHYDAEPATAPRHPHP